MNEFWQERTSREKALVLLLAVAMSFLLVFSVIYKPMVAKQAKLERQMSVYEAEIAWMNSQRDSLVALRSSAGAAVSNAQFANTSLSTLAQNYGRVFRPSITGHADGSITAKINSATFAAVVVWANHLTNAGAVITSIVINRHKKDVAHVSGSFKFKR